MPSTASTLLKSTPVRIAIVVIVVMIIAGASYYVIETRTPQLAFAAAVEGPIHEDVVATGDVAPIQNPDLAFTAGGRVTYIPVTVGQRVAAGTVLATLDTSILGANLQTAQAQLAQVEAPPRAVDIASAQTAVTQAQQNSANAYAIFPTTLLGAVTKASAAVMMTDQFFNYPDNSAPSLMTTYGSDYDGRTRVSNERSALNDELATWQSATAALSSAPLNASDAQARTNDSLAHLAHVRAFLEDLATVVRSTAVTPQTSQATINAGLATITAAVGNIDGITLSVQQAQQGLASSELAVQQANDALTSKQTGATSQAIAIARAQVNAAAAVLQQSEIIAPFSGTVAAVAVKAGDVVAPNTIALSLVPDGTYQVEVQVSELDTAKLATGDTADITLDAFGSGKTFSGTVASIATAPITVAGSPSYKVVIALDSKDPTVAVGMHANVTIHAAGKDQTLIVPKSAVTTDGSESIVLKKQGSGTVRTVVTTGLEDANSVEILSGLSAGDQVATVGGQ